MLLVFFFFWFIIQRIALDKKKWIKKENITFYYLSDATMKKKKKEYCILLFKIYRGTLLYFFCLSNLKKPIHQLKHFKVDRASLARNHEFFITIRIRFIMVPMLSSIMLSSVTSFKLVSNLISEVLIGSFAII